MLEQQIEFIYSGGEVKRYHTWPMLREDKVGTHSFRVAMLVFLLAGQKEPGIRVPLLMAALCHDLAEQKYGDIPAPAKREMPDYGGATFRTTFGNMEEALLADVALDWQFQLTDEERRILKLADAADGALTCIRERAMGNKLIRTVYHNFRRYVGEVAGVDEAECRLVEHIDDMWEQANGRE